MEKRLANYRLPLNAYYGLELIREKTGKSATASVSEAVMAIVNKNIKEGVFSKEELQKKIKDSL